jgi:hypothetical protein
MKDHNRGQTAWPLPSRKGIRLAAPTDSVEDCKQRVLVQTVTLACAVCGTPLVASVDEVLYGLPFYTCRKCFGFDVFGKKGESDDS